MEICILNLPFTRRYNRAGRWQASPRGNSLWYPAWLCYAAGVLEMVGHRVTLIDAPAERLSLEDTGQIVSQQKPDLIVIDTSTPSINSDIAAVNFLKDINPNSQVCLVGPHASALPEDILRQSQEIDFVAKGEYDYTLRDLAHCLEEGKDINLILGLYYRNGASVVYTGTRPYIDNLDELPFLSEVIKNHLNIKNYSLDFSLYPYIDLFTGRGCGFSCSYCLWNQTLMGRQYRKRSLDNVFKEIDFILKNMPSINELVLDDDTFTADHQRVMDFSRIIIERNYRFSWVVNMRPDIIDFGLLSLMRKAGCRAVVVGFESGSQRILNNIYKGTTVQRMEMFTRLCKKAGIQIHGDFMAGLPGETRKTIQETLDFVKKIQPDTFQFSVAVPFPGTEFYSWLSKNKFLVTENYSDWLDSDGRQRCVISYPEISDREIVKLVRRTYLRHYLRISYIIQAVLRILANPNEFTKFFIAGRRFVRFVFEKECT